MTVNRCMLCQRRILSNNRTGYCRSNRNCRRAADRERHAQTKHLFDPLMLVEGNAAIKNLRRREERVTVVYDDGWCVMLDGREVEIFACPNKADAAAEELRKRVRDGMVQRAVAV